MSGLSGLTDSIKWYQGHVPYVEFFTPDAADDAFITADHKNFASNAVIYVVAAVAIAALVKTFLLMAAGILIGGLIVYVIFSTTARETIADKFWMGCGKTVVFQAANLIPFSHM
jgi:hypothetical protein